jgi:hypothetical protein
VILNQVTWYYASGGATCRVHLLHVSSSGPITEIGYYIGPNFSILSGQLMPNPNATSPTQSTGVLYNGNYSSWLPANGAVYWGLGTASGQSYMPQNYWIGPGDSIAFSQYNDSSLSATVGYHFTTITES